jgi:glucose/arabinose dehydrogenase
MPVRPAALLRARRSLCRTLVLAVAGAVGSAPAISAADAQATITARSGVVPRDSVRANALLQQVKVPEGFRATIFAAPPVAMYPVCLTATVDGAVFVCVDPNLSLTAEKGKGRVVRLVDDNHDGVADRYTVFAQMDSPRGVAFDGRTLYVMHPPNLTAYRDTTGDGIADVSENIVTGLGFDLDFRGADHTTNGITLGIDGWLYIAVGDYGYRKAVGKDGTTISHRGGGVVRVRTDGTGFERYAQGTRNIYDLAVSPMLQLFTRDNTNDGDGWDIRLHYLPSGAHMGYPMYYKNFAAEHMPSLADYGAGSGTGGLWVHDPSFPAGFGNTLYTSDWLLNAVFRHPLTPRGGSFDVKQESFVSVPHPADMAMDGRGSMFVASLAGGSYTYAGDSVGYVLRVTPVSALNVAAPNIAKATDATLRSLLVSSNAEHRLQAQREILRRGERPGVVAALTTATLTRTSPPYARVAAMFTLTQLVGARSHATVRTAALDPAVRALALRALADHAAPATAANVAPFVAALSDTSAVVQMAAIDALVRRGAREAAPRIIPLTGSTDAAVAHLAVNALVSLGARQASVNALDAAAPAVRAGVLRALERMHDSAVVSALIARSSGASSRDLIVALARLYHREAEWTGDWWGTRPSFLGPYFAPVTWSESARIQPVLQRALLDATAADRASLTSEFVRNRVLPQGAAALVAATAGLDDASRREALATLVGNARVSATMMPAIARIDRAGAAAHAAVAQLLAAESPLADGALAMVRAAAVDVTIADDVRARLLNSLGAVAGNAALDAAAGALVTVTPAITPAGTPAAPLEAAWRRFVGDRRRLNELDYFITLSRSNSADSRILGFAVLLQSVRGGRAAAAVNDKVQPVLTAAWAARAMSPDLARAVGIMRLESAYAEPLAALRNAPSAPPAMDWVPLFNGKDLSNWDIKFTGSPVGVNYRNTFRVQNGMLQVRYDDWPDFSGEFGHIFTRQSYSNYIVAVEYRFVGEQVRGAGAGNSWAIRNNGIMVHAQSAASMGLKQDFPISLEVQLLGGLGRGTRTNGNLCTPGTHVVMNGKLITTHCINANSITYDGDQWVRVEAMVLGDSVLKHIVNGDTVMTYSKPQMGGGAANNTNPGVLVEGQPLAAGHIALQAETAPIEFRKVEIVNLEGCMTKGDANYRPYFVKSLPAACRKR